jgi:hypothetical protein
VEWDELYAAAVGRKGATPLLLRCAVEAAEDAGISSLKTWLRSNQATSIFQLCMALMEHKVPVPDKLEQQIRQMPTDSP